VPADHDARYSLGRAWWLYTSLEGVDYGEMSRATTSTSGGLLQAASPREPVTSAARSACASVVFQQGNWCVR
jgi:hypothetical protein